MAQAAPSILAFLHIPALLLRNESAEARLQEGYPAKPARSGPACRAHPAPALPPVCRGHGGVPIRATQPPGSGRDTPSRFIRRYRFGRSVFNRRATSATFPPASSSAVWMRWRS